MGSLFCQKWNIWDYCKLYLKYSLKILYLYVEYRHNTNTATLWKIGHTKGKSHMRGGE
jgi:hypothetical protein